MKLIKYITSSFLISLVAAQEQIAIRTSSAATQTDSITTSVPIDSSLMGPSPTQISGDIGVEQLEAKGVTSRQTVTFKMLSMFPSNKATFYDADGVFPVTVVGPPWAKPTNFVWFNVTADLGNPSVSRKVDDNVWRWTQAPATIAIPMTFPKAGAYALKPPKWTEVYVNNDCRPTPTTMTVVYTPSNSLPWTITRAFPSVAKPTMTTTSILGWGMGLVVDNLPCFANVALLERMPGDSFVGNHVLSIQNGNRDNDFQSTCVQGYTTRRTFYTSMQGVHTYQPMAYISTKSTVSAVYGPKVTLTVNNALRMHVNGLYDSGKLNAGLYGNTRLPRAKVTSVKSQVLYTQTATAQGFSVMHDGTTQCVASATYATVGYSDTLNYYITASCPVSLGTNCHYTTETWSWMSKGKTLATTTLENLNADPKLCPPTEVITSTTVETEVVYTTSTPTTTQCVTGKPRLGKFHARQVNVEEYSFTTLAPTTIKYKATWTKKTATRTHSGYGWAIDFVATATPPIRTPPDGQASYCTFDTGDATNKNAYGYVYGSNVTLYIQRTGVFRLLPSFTASKQTCTLYGWSCQKCTNQVTVFRPAFTSKWTVTFVDSTISTAPIPKPTMAPSVPILIESGGGSGYSAFNFSRTQPRVPFALMEKDYLLARSLYGGYGGPLNVKLGNGVHEIYGAHFARTTKVTSPSLLAGPIGTFTIANPPYSTGYRSTAYSLPTTLTFTPTLAWHALSEAAKVAVDAAPCTQWTFSPLTTTSIMDALASHVVVQSDGSPIATPTILQLNHKAYCGDLAAVFPTYQVKFEIPITPVCFPARQTVEVVDSRGPQALTGTVEWINSVTMGATGCPSTTLVTSTSTSTITCDCAETFTITRTATKC